VAFGENAIVIRQLLFGESVAPLQPSLDMAKSPALIPEMVAEMLDRGAFPMFVRVAVALDAPGEMKESVAGESVADRIAPVPASETVWNIAGLP
jgi:hypothetical protein